MLFILCLPWTLKVKSTPNQSVTSTLVWLWLCDVAKHWVAPLAVWSVLPFWTQLFYLSIYTQITLINSSFTKYKLENTPHSLLSHYMYTVTLPFAFIRTQCYYIAILILAILPLALGEAALSEVHWSHAFTVYYIFVFIRAETFRPSPENESLTIMIIN